MLNVTAFGVVALIDVILDDVGTRETRPSAVKADEVTSPTEDALSAAELVATDVDISC